MTKGKNKTPTQKTLAWLRDRGYEAVNVETQQRHSFHKNDLLGFADLLAMRPGSILLVQTTTSSHHANRRKKIYAERLARIWLVAGGEIMIQSWREDGTSREEYISDIPNSDV